MVIPNWYLRQNIVRLDRHEYVVGWYLILFRCLGSALVKRVEDVRAAFAPGAEDLLGAVWYARGELWGILLSRFLGAHRAVESNGVPVIVEDVDIQVIKVVRSASDNSGYCC